MSLQVEDCKRTQIISLRHQTRINLKMIIAEKQKENSNGCNIASTCRGIPIHIPHLNIKEENIKVN